MIRRQFIQIAGLGFVSALSYRKLNSSLLEIDMVENTQIFSAIITKAKQESWEKMEFGDLLVRIGREFLGTSYVGGTLEGEPEICRVDLTGMDCVTFYEYCLCFARIIKLRKTHYQDLVNELIFVRYRNGVLTDYTSRLHYTSDWIDNNVSKHVVEDITRDIGGEIYNLHVDFMSTHPQYYPALKDNPEMIRKIAAIENDINSRTHYYIPKQKVKRTEQFLKNGDIIALATDKKGLDYAHTGLAFTEKPEEARFLHASSKQKKVTLDVRLYQYMANIKSDIGISVARPIFNLK